jgi:hypothetical protein
MGARQVFDNPQMTEPLSLPHPLPDTELAKRIAAQAPHYHHVEQMSTPTGLFATCTESAEDPI